MRYTSINPNKIARAPRKGNRILIITGVLTHPLVIIPERTTNRKDSIARTIDKVSSALSHTGGLSIAPCAFIRIESEKMTNEPMRNKIVKIHKNSASLMEIESPLLEHMPLFVIFAINDFSIL